MVFTRVSESCQYRQWSWQLYGRCGQLLCWASMEVNILPGKPQLADVRSKELWRCSILSRTMYLLLGSTLFRLPGPEAHKVTKWESLGIVGMDERQRRKVRCRLHQPHLFSQALPSSTTHVEPALVRTPTATLHWHLTLEAGTGEVSGKLLAHKRTDGWWNPRKPRLLPCGGTGLEANLLGLGSACGLATHPETLGKSLGICPIPSLLSGMLAALSHTCWAVRRAGMSEQM